MIYLDYSATTPINDEVLDSYNKTSLQFIGNTNSLHTLGVDARELMDMASEQISDLLDCNIRELIYTSGSTEANNLALKGVANFYKNRGRHIITTKFEHSSISETVNYLSTIGFDISYVELSEEGLVDIDHLKSLITKDTILVTIGAVNSETGIKQDINKLGKIIKEINPSILFHTDATQAIGKIPFTLENIDMMSFTSHKFFGLKGIGCLYKKEKINIVPLLHGGKSQTEFRAGTPALPLIVSFAKAFRLSVSEIAKDYRYVKELNEYLMNELNGIDRISINSNQFSVPHIINISIKGIKPETMLHTLAKKEIYISTQSACSTTNKPSSALLAMKKSMEVASSSVRISISKLTSKKEIDEFIVVFKEAIANLSLKE